MHLVLCEEKSDEEKLLHRRDHVGRLTCLKSALLLRKPNSVKTCYLATSGHVHRAKKKKKMAQVAFFASANNNLNYHDQRLYGKKKCETPKTLVLTVSTFRTQTQTPRKNLIYTANKKLISLWPAGVKGPSDFLRGFLRFGQSSPRIRQRDRTNTRLHESNTTESATGPSNDKPLVLRK